MPSVQGNLQGLKPSQLKALERLYKRRIPANQVCTQEQARELALLSRSINRQIALLINRHGKVEMVLVGSAGAINIPDLGNLASGRLRGLRLLHTHLTPDGLSQEDLMDMLFLRLDAIVALTVNPLGEPMQWQSAFVAPPELPQSLLVLPQMQCQNSCYLLYPRLWHDTDCDFAGLAQDIEKALNGKESVNAAAGNVFLVSVSPEPVNIQEQHLEELAALTVSAELTVAGTMTQRVTRPDNRFILGKGKLLELEVQALNARADILIFDGELTPSQLANLAEVTERKVLDRTQLILDIFAQHAVTRAGRLQVELAQLSYGLPRLAGKGKALDRLSGGIGGRGPGETRLETDRRKIRLRMAQLKKALKQLQRQRGLERQQRERNAIPVAALVGYTNAGKSSLLNKLTESDVLVENKLFATLDPITRRLRFPREREITLADTVGFIRNLPKELMESFRATLEELRRADVLIHVCDASHGDLDGQIAAVNLILEELELSNLPQILIFNKWDRVTPEMREALLARYSEALPVSAKDGSGLAALMLRLEQELFLRKCEITAS